MQFRCLPRILSLQDHREQRVRELAVFRPVAFFGAQGMMMFFPDCFVLIGIGIS